MVLMVEKMQDALYIVVSVMAIAVDRKFDTRAKFRESVSLKVAR